jgi:hypothetical protein
VTKTQKNFVFTLRVFLIYAFSLRFPSNIFVLGIKYIAGIHLYDISMPIKFELSHQEVILSLSLRN